MRWGYTNVLLKHKNENNMEMTLSIIIGVISSVVASFIFLIAIRLLKPKIKIAPNITKSRANSGKIIYVIKIMNRSRRSIINVQAKLQLIYTSHVSGGPVVTSKDLTLKRNEIFQIQAYGKSKEKKEKADYGFRFITYDNIEQLIKSKPKEYKIRLSIICNDELTGLGKVFTKVFEPDDIVEGRFKQGDTFKIIKDKLNKKNEA